MAIFDIKPPRKSSKKLKPFSFELKPVRESRSKKPRMTNLIFGLDHPKPARKVKGKLAMDWGQAKKKYPKMSPFGDADKDGVQNWLDCKPFDPHMQGRKRKPKPYSEKKMIEIRRRPEVVEMFRIQQRNYDQSPIRVARRKVYNQIPEVKEKIKIQKKEYYQRPYVKEKKKKYYQRPEIKEKMKEYRQKPEVKEKLKEYQQTPERIEKIKDYYKRPEVKKKMNERKKKKYHVTKKNKDDFEKILSIQDEKDVEDNYAQDLLDSIPDDEKVDSNNAQHLLDEISDDEKDEEKE